MDSLHVHRTVTELLNAVILASFKDATPESKSHLSIHIGTKGGHETDERLLFHVKVGSSHAIDLEKCQKDSGSSLSELCHLLKLMQSVDDESHLCVQTLDLCDTSKILQRNYRANTHGDGSEDSVLQCNGIFHKKRRNEEGTNIILRMYEKRSEMMVSSKKIYHHLRLLSFVTPQIRLDFVLKIQDNVCYFEFESPTVLSESGHHISGNVNYILKDSQYTAVTPSVIPHSGHTKLILGVHVHGEQSIGVRVQAVASVVNCRWKKYLKSLIMMSVYGPHRLPLQTSAEDWEEVIYTVPWKEYGFRLLQHCDHSMHFNADVVFGLEDITNQKRCHHCLMIYLFIEEEVNSAGYILANWLKGNKRILTSKYGEDISKSVNSAVSKALSFRVKTADNKTTRCYSKAIPCIAKSISNILLRSSNEDFRKKSFELLKIESARAAETVLMDKLWEIAASSYGVVAPSGDKHKQEWLGGNRACQVDTHTDQARTDNTSSAAGLDTELTISTLSDRQNAGSVRSKVTQNVKDKGMIGSGFYVENDERLNTLPLFVMNMQSSDSQNQKRCVEEKQNSSQNKHAMFHSVCDPHDTDFHSLSESHVDDFTENEAYSGTEIKKIPSAVLSAVPNLMGGDDMSCMEPENVQSCSVAMVTDDAESKDFSDLMSLSEKESDFEADNLAKTGERHFPIENILSNTAKDDSEVWFDEVLMEVQDWLDED